MSSPAVHVNQQASYVIPAPLHMSFQQGHVRERESVGSGIQDKNL